MATVAERLLDAIEERDFDAIAACFADDATLHAIVPKGLREDEGRVAIESRFRLWLGEEGEHELIDREATIFADVIRLRYAIRSAHPGEQVTVFEQTAYVEIEQDEVVSVRITCSGPRALVPAPVS